MTLALAITLLALIASTAADRKKTVAGIRKGIQMFLGILPLLLGMLSVLSLVKAAVSPEALEAVLGRSGPIPFVAALLVGSIALMPGFVAYPLAGTLKANGASIEILAAFITTLMMVGFVTLPVEAKFLGWRIAVYRNALSFIGAVIVALAMGMILR